MYMTSRAAQFYLAGRMRPVGRRLESPEVDTYKYILPLAYDFNMLTHQTNKQTALIKVLIFTT